MLKFFGRWVIGGRSGKREQAWFFAILWCIACAWMMRMEAMGISLPNTQALLSISIPLVFANIAIAHGMEWWGTSGPGKDDTPLFHESFEGRE